MNYIFDFDGTLMDTSGVILATIKASIKEMGLPEKTEEECRSIIGIRTNEAGKYLYPDLDISNEEFARVFRSNYDRLKQGAEEKTFPGVMETLRRLHESGCGLAIASSRRVYSLEAYLNGLGIRDMFDAAGCRTCAVTYGNGSIASLKEASPDYIIDDFSVIPNL